MPEARQWLSSSAGRVASDGYSWMQSVHWVAGSGLYQPRLHRCSGLRSFNTTTVRVAQELARLWPCYPGVDFLVRRTGLTKRAVEYHLAALRETGLLAYVAKGTRVSGVGGRASVFKLMIPPEFDAALGIRTVLRDPQAPAYTRAVVGIAEAGRELMARLGKKACRRVRKPRTKAPSPRASKGARKAAGGAGVTAVSAGARCTPMQGGTDGSSAAGSISLPPENKLASGAGKSPTPKKSSGKANARRKLNPVGRRFQLAKELTAELDWLRGCSVARIAWVARAVADAGWTVTEVTAWLDLRGGPAQVRRGSGLLATLLAGAETILDTPVKRAAAVDQWRGAQEAARRHRIEQVRARAERYEGDWEAPASRAVRHEVEAAFAQVRESVRGGRSQGQDDDVIDAPAAGTEPSEQELADLRRDAEQLIATGDTSLVVLAISIMGHEAAEDLYGPPLVHRALQLSACSRSSLVSLGRR